MKTEFKAKFLQHVAKRKREEGFTLIELLVVIIIIGILSAIALPSFLNQANKAKQSEAKQYLASINKGQQAFYTEKSTFASEIDTLGVGIKTQTTNYQYECDNPDGKAGVNCTGTANENVQASLQSYTGAVYLVQVSTGESTSRSLLCQTKETGTDPATITMPATAFTEGDDPTCDSIGMEDV
jgi:prepilin-type N-terminal cleavage/methylation domain-containing protein